MVETTEEATNKIEGEEEHTSNTEDVNRLATDDMSFNSPNDEVNNNPADQAIN